MDGGVLPNSKRHTNKKEAESKELRRGPKKQTRKRSSSKKKSSSPENVQKKVKKRSSSSKKRTSSSKNSSLKVRSKRSKNPSARRSTKKRSSKSSSPTIFGQFCAIVLGAMFGGITCLTLMYQQAVDDVSTWLNPMVISPPQQKIYTAPLQFTIQQYVDQNQVEELLLDAGYIESKTDPNGGSFLSNKDQIVVRNDAGDLHHIDFIEGVISNIRKKGVEVSSMSTQPIPLYTIKAQSRERRKIPITDIPLFMQQSIVAVEDSRFYEHEGIDFIGVMRAIFINLVAQSKSQGASTITQQIVKNLILVDPEKTYARKIRELLRAIALERTLMESLVRTVDPKRALKEELLEIYLNEVYLGHVQGREVRGVSEGAQIFFGKPIQKISLGEAATLAGIISSPNGYSPVRHPERAQTRRDIALLRMSKMDFISEMQKEMVQKEELHVHYRPNYKKSPWFVDYMLARIESESIAQSDIPTSLDPVLQLQAQKALKTGLKALEKKHPKAKGSNAAIIVLNNADASVAAMVGGRDYRTSSFNRALYAKRQVGSIAKPFWTALAMEENSDLFPGCWIADKQISLGTGSHTWTPKNYDRAFLGAISLRDALSTSRNIPFVHLYQELKKSQGVPWTQQRFAALDLQIPPYPSAALGSFSASPYEMARAFTVFPSGGMLPDGSKWVSSASSDLVNDMMRSVMIEGTGKSVEKYAPERYLHGKSGTTDGGRDAWFVGFDKDYTIAVWVGFDKDKSLGLGGATAALPIFGRFVQLSGLGQEELPVFTQLAYQNFCADAPDCLQTKPDLVPKGKPFSSRCTLDDMVVFTPKEKQGFWSSIFSF